MKKGFTLIELLVAIALVSVLAALGISSFVNTQQVARNSKRTSDLKALQGALESYYSANAAYPANCNPVGFLPAGVPRDPKTGATYIAPTPPSAATCSANGYCICSQLEATTVNGNANATTCASASFVAGSYFCITQLQQ